MAADKDQIKVARFEKLADEYYAFFRLGGGMSMGAYKALDDIERAAALAAQRKIREEDMTFTLRGMKAVFERVVAEAMGSNTAGPVDKKSEPDPKASDEEVAVSKVMDEMQEVKQ